ncbi:MAG: hemolysin family protein [Planctomycetota bacterium]
MLSDAIVRTFSRSQLEEVLDDRDASAVRRWFCLPLLSHGEAASIACCLLNIATIGTFLIYTWSHLYPDYSLVASITILALPLLILALLANIGSRLHTEELLVSLAAPLWFFCLPLLPFGKLVVKMEEYFASLFQQEGEDESEDREEIIAAVTDGEHEGVVEEDEREMIVNIFDLKRFDISDIMTPRTDLCSVSIETPLEEAMATAHESGYSRIPVYKETRDNIQGIFFVKDTLKLWSDTPKALPSLGEIMRPPFFVPESKNVGELMRELQEKKTHMAIVLDEYGGTAGLVTIEDVIEEIVGEIHDEYDVEEEVFFREVSPNVFDTEARTHVHDINEMLDEKIIPEAEDYETLAGFVLDQLGHVPEVGESLTFDCLKISILESDERKVEKVRVERLEEREEGVASQAS